MEDELTLLKQARWDDLTAEQPEATKTLIERAPLDTLPPHLAEWRRDGVMILKNLIPHDLLDAYAEVRAQLPKDRNAKDNFWGGWSNPTPYVQCPAMLDLATAPILMASMRALIGEAMGLHLCLTGWVSTERSYHQDTYLNPDDLWSHYCAAWIAMDDIAADSGPFEFVRGSHLWPALRRDRLFAQLPDTLTRNPAWPSITQDEVGRVCSEEMIRREAHVESFTPSKGDVLLWHSNLVHRGSRPTNPDALRKALICHYSSLQHRTDMRSISRNPRNGQLYFDFKH